MAAREKLAAKGHGLAVAIDVPTGILAGGMFGNPVHRKQPDDVKLAKGSSHFFAALRVDHFRPVAEFKAAMDDMLRALKDSEKADGHDRIYAHGEIEFETQRERRQNGIPYHPVFADYLRQMASEFDIPLEMAA